MTPGNTLSPGAAHDFVKLAACGSHPADEAEIKMWGGRRPGSGRPRRAPPAPFVPPPIGLRWFCIQAQPRAELRAHGELLAHGFEAHLPLQLTERTRHGEAITRISPFFPGYLFARFDRDAEHWRWICALRGVRRIFGATPECPLPVPAGMVEALMARAGPDGVIDCRPKPLAAIPAGAVVRITDGPFADLMAVCQWSSAKRVQLLLDVMGSRTPISLPRTLVQSVIEEPVMAKKPAPKPAAKPVPQPAPKGGKKGK